MPGPPRAQLTSFDTMADSARNLLLYIFEIPRFGVSTVSGQDVTLPPEIIDALEAGRFQAGPFVKDIVEGILHCEPPESRDLFSKYLA